MSKAVQQLAYAFSPFGRLGSKVVSSVESGVASAVRSGERYVVKDDKEFADLPKKLFYSTLAR